MLVVGLTGGIASGKSTVSNLIAKHPADVPVIDLDLLAREVVEPGQPTLQALVKEFGNGILASDGTLDRPALGRIVFGNPEKTKVLNKLTHGAIRRRMAWRLVKYWLTGRKVVVVDTPLLVEAGMWRWCGEVAVVWCSYEDQLKRMLERDSPTKGLTKDDAINRLNSQFKLEDKLVYADAILDNSSALSSDGTAQSPAWAEGIKASSSLKVQVDRLVSRWHHQSSSGLGWVRWLFEWVVPPFGLLMGIWTATRRRAGVEQRKSSGVKIDPTRARL